MDYARNIAIMVGVFLAIVMLCCGIGFLSYTYGQSEGHNSGYAAGQKDGSSQGYEAGYETGLRAAGSSYDLHAPTYREMKEFIARDSTNSKEYVKDKYLCSDFSTEVNNNAEAEGIRCATVDIFYPEGYGHTIVAFETIDKGLVYIEPQFDHEVRLVIGESYSQTNNYNPAPHSDVVERILTSW